MGGFKKSRTKFPQNLLLIHTNKALLMLEFPSTLTLFPCTCGINLSERLSFLSLKPLMVPHCPEDKVRTFHLPSLPTWIARFYSYCFSHPPQTQGYSITKTSHYDHYLSFKAKHKCCLIHRALLISPEQKWGLFLQFSVDDSPHTIHGPHLRLLMAINHILFSLAWYTLSLQERGYVFRTLNPLYA